MGRKPDGSRDRRHVSGKKRAVVVRKVRDLERRRDEGRMPAAGKAPTVEKWLTHWLTNIAARKIRPRTLEIYWSRARAWIIPCLGSYRLDRLQPEHVESLYTQLADKGLSDRSVRLAHTTLSQALRAAVRRGSIVRNVCTRAAPPSVQQREVDPPTRADARAILKAAKGRRNAARWSVALALGLRQGEALGLQWRYVDLEAGTLRM